MTSYDVTIMAGSKMAAILDFLILPEPLKSARIDQKVTETIKEHKNDIKNVKLTSEKLQFFQ